MLDANLLAREIGIIVERIPEANFTAQMLDANLIAREIGIITQKKS